MAVPRKAEVLLGKFSMHMSSISPVSSLEAYVLRLDFRSFHYLINGVNVWGI